jgi:hypothetical protein
VKQDRNDALSVLRNIQAIIERFELPTVIKRGNRRPKPIADSAASLLGIAVLPLTDTVVSRDCASSAAATHQRIVDQEHNDRSRNCDDHAPDVQAGNAGRPK